MNKQPLILITNDDGIHSPGIETLRNYLSELGEVVIAAPDGQRSATSSALTITRPLRAFKFHKNGDFFGYAIDGTPADCVKLAVTTLLDRKPDLIVSGINHGKNTSINVLYSGTVAGATEGLISGISSIAVSHSSHSLDSDLSVAGRYSNILARKLLQRKTNGSILLNVNVPDIPEEMVKGIKFTRLSSAKWADKYERRLDPFGNEYFWFAGAYMITDSDISTDDGAVNAGYVSVSPINLNLYDNDFLLNIEEFEDINDVGNNLDRQFAGRNGTG